MASVRHLLLKDCSTQEERENKYGGDHIDGHTQCGKIWGALLTQYLNVPVPSLPAGLVEAMMAGFKLCRLAENPKDPDHYRDARVYLALSQQSFGAEDEGTPTPPERKKEKSADDSTPIR